MINNKAALSDHFIWKMVNCVPCERCHSENHHLTSSAFSIFSVLFGSTVTLTHFLVAAGSCFHEKLPNLQTDDVSYWLLNTEQYLAANEPAKTFTITSLYGDNMSVMSPLPWARLTLPSHEWASVHYRGRWHGIHFSHILFSDIACPKD